MNMTKVPEGYEWADRREIVYHEKRFGMETVVAPELFQDLLNVSRGGEVLTEVEVFDETNHSPVSILDNRTSGQRLKANLSARGFVQQIADSGVMDTLPGSGLDKAAALVRMLMNRTKSQDQPDFEKHDGKSLGQQMTKAIESAQNADDIDLRELGMENQQGNDLESVLKRAEKMMDIPQNDLELIRLSAKLDTLVVMKTAVKQLRKKSPVPTRHIHVRGVRSLDEIRSVHRTSHALPDDVFWKKAVNSELQVREYSEYAEQKQLMYALVDSSGSMRAGYRTLKSAAFIYNRCKAVLRGEAEFYLRLFESYPEEPLYSIRNEREAAEMVKKIRSGELFDGGGTNFTAAIDKALEDIQQDQDRFHRCDIFMITDGEAPVKRFRPMNGVELQVFSVVDEINKDLRRYASNYFVIDDHMRIR